MHRRAIRSAVTVLAAAALACTTAGPSVAGAAARPAESGDGWDAKVAPIAARVEKLRDLSFEHPVPVRYLTDAAFRKRVGVKESKLTRSQRRKIADLQATLRAFGLIDAETDIVESIDAVSGAGTLAFYDPKDREIVVRGKGPLDVNRKVTLAHELTHALQDQHFDIAELQRAASDSETSSPGALTALIEGDAERIQDEFLSRLSSEDQEAYDANAAEEAESVVSELESAPEIVKMSFAAPYVFGPMVLDVLTAHGGNRAVDDALQRGAPTDKIYLEPSDALRDPKATKVPAPAIPKGARRVGTPDEIGAFDLYTLLASRIDRQDALNAADAWAGDRYVAYRKGGRVCARATIASTRSGSEALGNALRAWAGAMPGATVQDGPGPRRITATSCDTGGVSAPTAEAVEGAVRLLAVRNSFYASAEHAGVPRAIGKCVAHRIVQDPVFASTIDQDGEPPAAVQDQLRELTVTLARDCASRRS